MSAKDVLAIDFGTANTYYCKCPGDRLSPQGVDFGDGRDGLATAILYRKGKSPLIGHPAMAEYGEATAQERSGYVLRTHFKPDIATGEEARRNAADFLGAVLEEARQQRLDLEPGSRQVIFGVPSEAGADYREALTEAAQKAGYGEIQMVDEPKGALLYHVFHRDIPARDALRGLLVVDFGGGTCDFAFLCRGNVRHSWGDMRLGGRLFDDLFFQWFMDDNPGALEALRKDGSEFFVHSCRCREIKELFSRAMARDRSEKVTKAVDKWRIADMTWEAFLRRSRSYSPSATLKQYLADIGGCAAVADARNGSVDLLSWFRSCLIDGIRAAKIDKGDIRFVILAGGSSQWPFVSDIVQEELGVEQACIMRSDRPYAAISEGLAIHPALQAQYRATQGKLREELPQFCNGELKPLLDRRFQKIAQDIAAAVARELFDHKIKPLFVELRTKGGSVAALRQSVTSITSVYEPRLQELVQERVSALAAGLKRNVNELKDKWFDKHGIVPADEDLGLEGAGAEEMEKPKVELPDIYDSIIRIPLGFLGGLLVGLLASGPIGWIIGIVLVIVAEIVGQAAAEEWDAPAWVLKMALTDGKIAKTREKMAADIKSAMQQKLSGIQDALAKEVSQQVEREIDSLSDINHL